MSVQAAGRTAEGVRAQRAKYLKPRLFVDISTSARMVGTPPIGITRVETRIARALLAAPELDAVPVFMGFDGKPHVVSRETAGFILDLWREQPDVPLTLRQKHGSREIALPGLTDKSQFERQKSHWTRVQDLRRKYFKTRVLFSQP